MPELKFSFHALQRWTERFPSLLLHDEFANATEGKLSKRDLKTVARQMKLVKGHKYRVSKNGCIFVLAGDGVVVTVIKREESC